MLAEKSDMVVLFRYEQLTGLYPDVAEYKLYQAQSLYKVGPSCASCTQLPSRCSVMHQAFLFSDFRQAYIQMQPGLHQLWIASSNH